MQQTERLRILGQWVKRELETADLYDLDTVRALKAMITPIAEALNLSDQPIDPGSHGDVIVLTIVHDTDRGGYWGTCEVCGLISSICETEDAVMATAFGTHMERTHPSFTVALNHEEVTAP